MIDRGIIKWKPFDSCYSSKKLINSTVYYSKPTIYYSDDQYQEMEHKIWSAYKNQSDIEIKYLNKGNIITKLGKITNIDSNEKKICLNNKSIYFQQIIEIN